MKRLILLVILALLPAPARAGSGIRFDSAASSMTFVGTTYGSAPYNLSFAPSDHRWATLSGTKNDWLDLGLQNLSNGGRGKPGKNGSGSSQSNGV